MDSGIEHTATSSEGAVFPSMVIRFTMASRHEILCPETEVNTIVNQVYLTSSVLAGSSSMTVYPCQWKLLFGAACVMPVLECVVEYLSL